MADEDDRKWLPPTDPDDDKPGDTLPGVPGSFSGGPDVPGSGPGGGSGLSSGDPLGGGSTPPPPPPPPSSGSGSGSGSGSEGGGLWSSPPGPPTPPSSDPGQSAWGAPSQPPTSPGGGWGPPPGQQQTFPPYQQDTGKTNTKATAALVLGILGLIICPFICSVLALIFGYQARGEIDRSGGRESGRGLATAGVVTGWIGIAFTVLFIILAVVGVFAFDTDDFDDGNDVGRPAVLLAARALTLLPL